MTLPAAVPSRSPFSPLARAEPLQVFTEPPSSCLAQTNTPGASSLAHATTAHMPLDFWHILPRQVSTQGSHSLHFESLQSGLLGKGRTLSSVGQRPPLSSQCGLTAERHTPGLLGTSASKTGTLVLEPGALKTAVNEFIEM